MTAAWAFSATIMSRYVIMLNSAFTVHVHFWKHGLVSFSTWVKIITDPFFHCTPSKLFGKVYHCEPMDIRGRYVLISYSYCGSCFSVNGSPDAPAYRVTRGEVLGRSDFLLFVIFAISQNLTSRFDEEDQIDELIMQEIRNSIAKAPELRFSCTNPSK